jgi:hypothetical protein
MIGVVNKDLLFFCPIDDEATRDAIARLIESALTTQHILRLAPDDDIF